MRFGVAAAVALGVGVFGCGSHVQSDPGDGLHGAGGTTSAPTDNPGGGAPCPPFQERLDGLCQRVKVVGVDERTVKFVSGGYELPGTLTLPVTQGAYSAVGAIIVHGNGPGPRDGTSSQNLGFAYPKPVHTYENLALTLAHAGLAVLRYDKRSCFHETVPACKNSVFDYPGDPGAIVLDDFVADARAAARYVSERPEVRDQGVVAIGHSEGGVLATALVQAEGPVGSAVLLGAPALPFEDTAAGQLESYADYLQGLGDAYQSEVDELHAKAARWRNELGQIRAGTYPSDSWEGASVSYVRSTLSWYDRIDERFTALERPVLVLSGLADFNVGPGHLEHYAALAADNYQHNVSTHALPDVTHAFCVAPDASGWGPFEPDLAPEARQQLLSWLGADDPQLAL